MKINNSCQADETSSERPLLTAEFLDLLDLLQKSGFEFKFKIVGGSN